VTKSALSVEQQHARAANAVADLLERQLVVPRIYFEASWAKGIKSADVLAVDRDGAGDIHLAEVTFSDNLTDVIDELMSMPAHYRYVATYKPSKISATDTSLYSRDGYGRIGIIGLADREGEIAAEVLLRPERFRVSPDVYAGLDRFAKRVTPDRQFRG
jgi:hypothetical protein